MKGAGPHKVKCAFGSSKEFNQLVADAGAAQQRADQNAGQEDGLKNTDLAAEAYNTPTTDLVKQRLADARSKMREKMAGAEQSAKRQKASLMRNLSKD